MIRSLSSPKWLLALALAITTIVYWPGLYGTWLFDDYPNIVDNHGVQPASANLASLVNAALSSPASDFKRPLASISFALNYLATGLDPYWMKLTNLVIHLFNGLLVYVLARMLLVLANREPDRRRAEMAAALIAGGWMLLPINLTAVLYTVQRMESMANLFVLIGLIGYISGRRKMLSASLQTTARSTWTGFALSIASLAVFTLIGLLAKETAVMLPLYAVLIEWTLFRFRNANGAFDQEHRIGHSPFRDYDWRIVALFLIALVIPMIAGLAWLLPGLLKPEVWVTRDFTLKTRLLSETRIVIDYLHWTLLPTPPDLSFYHDNFNISSSLTKPWTTCGSMAGLAALLAFAIWLRDRRPLVTLGIFLFLGCQLLTATILPLELIYEHRNYFASFGVMLAVIPLLAAPARSPADATLREMSGLPFSRSRHVLLAGLLLCWAIMTAVTAYAWGNPLRLAIDLAARAPDSPRAQYELGRTYIIYSQYDPSSPFTKLAYAPLEKAASLPDSSILPEQALIFMNSRMHLPLKDVWWDSLVAKLQTHKPGVQDESSLAALTQCVLDHLCDLPANRMVEAFTVALSHPNPGARLFANYGNYGWNVLDDKALGLRMTEAAIKADPGEPAYRITQIRMLAALGQKDNALDALKQLEALNYGGRLNSTLAQLRLLPELQ